MKARARKAPPRDDLAADPSVVELVAGDEQATWLLLARPYAREALVPKHLVPKARLLEQMGLLERNPTATAGIYRCTEKGEEVAQALLAFFGAERV